jgi:hypothetical protein
MIAANIALAALLPNVAQAQTTNCTTFYLSDYYSNSTCSTYDPTAYYRALVDLYALRVEAAELSQIEAQQQQQAYAAWLNTGMDTYNEATGVHTWLPAFTLIKFVNSPAIYAVYGGGLHAFQTWNQFLSVGGRPDLSNVMQPYSHWDGPVGDPVPLR